MSQHITSLGLARGFSTPMAPQRSRAINRHGTLEPYTYYEDADTDTEENPTVTNSLEVTRTASVFQNTVQMQISELLVTASRQ
jgi:hypothetical protein